MVINTLNKVLSGGKLDLGTIIKTAKQEVEANYDKLQIGPQTEEPKKLSDGNS